MSDTAGGGLGLGAAARSGWPAIVLALLLGVSVPATRAWAQEVPDPIEPVNRAIFSFNMVADQYVLEPVARGYRAVAPPPVRRSVGNFLANLRAPVIFANDLLQGERERAGITLGRFMINTTLGVFGLFDAAAAFGYARHGEDFGQTLGVWGAPAGPYLMLPLLGPSSLRDATGRVGDWFINPLSNCCIDTDERFGLLGAGAVSEREANIEVIDDLRANSLDLYATVRTVYAQQRQSEIRNGAPAPPQGGYDELFKDDNEGLE